ncbi:DNA polymerase III subunit delta [Ahrensia sp. R2A130]|uniref:DNA polymerase III subunit delta n=1 Tax=Ahrensia sp. R2A130 TaxID=744979 RepID=UPI0001E0AC8D|nr:DNA polymerase III subunit delta [Ahrensia sp. R2A130]EFL89694.1 DNA polymerase III, delta subunit [Ahrensia sp. R2A130]
MAQLKASEADRRIAAMEKSGPDHALYLIYGPDHGLAFERASRIAKSSGADMEDAFATVRLDADDAASDPSRLADEAHTVSMFGGKRLIWVRGTTRKNLLKAVEPLLALPPEDAVVIIETGDLKKTAALRSRIEKSPHALAVPCYADGGAAVSQLVADMVQQAGKTIDRETARALVDLLGGDRLASRGEIDKLLLYTGEDREITMDHVSTIVGDAASLAIDSVVDAAATGDMAKMEKTTKRLLAQGTAPFLIINACLRHFQMLHMARARMASSRQDAGSIIGGLRPPINFQRKDAVVRALRLWSGPDLEKTSRRLDAVLLECRSNAALEQPLLMTMLLAITRQAQRLSRLN